MRPTDPTFGQGFVDDQFRNPILSVMEMATPNQVKDRPTFIWDNEVEFAEVDSGGIPYDFNAAPIKAKQGKQVQALCVVEYVDRNGNDTPMGHFEHPRAMLTMLDVEYAKIEGASKVVLNGSIYTIDKKPPLVAMFGVDVYFLSCQAEDES